MDQNTGDRDSEPKTKICSRPDCPQAGKPQPLENFGRRNDRPDGRDRYCRECRNRLQREYRTKVRAEREKNKSLLQLQAVAESNMIVPVNFAEYPDLLERIREEAKEQVRNTNQQILFMLKQQVALLGCAK